MSEDGSAAILIRNVPGDVVRALEARARANYRSRYCEVLAILTAVCRGQIVLPAACAVGTEQAAAACAVGNAQDARLAPCAQDKADAARGEEVQG